jgi:hypothetical protein
VRAIEYADRQSMQIDADKIERLDEQSELLLRMYQLELAKDPGSHATAVSRSNMIALRHAIDQIYGGARFVDPVVSDRSLPSPQFFEALAQVLTPATSARLQFSQSSPWSLSRDNRRQIIQRLKFTPHLHCGHWLIFRRRHSIRGNQASVTMRLCAGLSRAEFALLAHPRAASRATDRLNLFESRPLGLHG